MVKSFTPLALVACLLASSCNSLFDSYYPASTELVEGQYDLQALFQTPINDVQMRALTTFAPYLAIQATAESTKVVLLDTKTMTALRVLSEDDLRGLTGGYVPKLLPLVEGKSGANPVLSFGEVSFVASNWASPVFGGIPTLGGTTENRATFDGSNTLVADNSTNHIFGSQLSLISGGIGAVGFAPLSNPRLLDFNGSATLGAVIMLDDVSFSRHVKLFQFNFLAFSSLAWGSPTGEANFTGDLRSAYVTATAAVLLVHPQNGGQTAFRAYGWDGTPKATLPLIGDGGITPPVCFDKEGIYWYLYDSHNGHLQQYRIWW